MSYQYKKIGILAVFGASIMWAIEPIFAKLAYVNSDFIQTSAVRAVFAALIALLYVSVINKSNLKVSKNQFPKLVYIALAGTVIADLLYFFSLTKIPIINATLIGHMQSVFIILFGYLFLKEDKLTRFDYFGIFTMIISGLFVTTKNFDNLLALRFGSPGDLLVLLTAAIWATGNIVMRRHLKTLNAGVITFYRFSIASVVFIIYLLFTSSKFISNYYQIFVGIAVGIGTIFCYEGFKRLKAAQVTALELSTPFFAAILAFIILKEQVTFMQILGIMLLGLGICFLSKKE